ncbi:MAG: ABC transporter permease [Acidimicrobiales bacterium]
MDRPDGFEGPPSPTVFPDDDGPRPPSTPRALPPGNRGRGEARAKRQAELALTDTWRPRWLWAAFAVPGGLWLILLFVIPFYAMIAVAAGQLQPFFGTPVATWNPLHWVAANFIAIWQDLSGPHSFIGPAAIRTVIYTAIASALSLVIAYPVAYFVTRFAGKRRGLFLILIVAPFWVSYMMRMLAWIDLLQTNGYVNQAISFLHLTSQPVNWLGGEHYTVILGLVYGYIPYLIVVLYAGLDRIDSRLLEASRDLGLGRARTFWRVTIPLSRPTILAGMLVTVLPMLGDYYTNQLLSATPSTTMIGNQIESMLSSPGQGGEGAALSLLMLVVLVVPMLYYVISTARASRLGGI